jgi:hypothetical protein
MSPASVKVPGTTIEGSGRPARADRRADLFDDRRSGVTALGPSARACGCVAVRCVCYICLGCMSISSHVVERPRTITPAGVFRSMGSRIGVRCVTTTTVAAQG